MTTAKLLAEVNADTTLSERAFGDMMWYLVNSESRFFSYRSARGRLVAIWAAITFLIRLTFHIIFLRVLALSRAPSSIFEKLQAHSSIKFEELPDYQYEPLSGPTEIRILLLHPGHKYDDISCDLKNISLDNRCEYEAISYAWGEASKMHCIRCDNAVIKVRQNLYSALRQFRHKSKIQILWVDALCMTLLLQW
jgi:hypothetical protein